MEDINFLSEFDVDTSQFLEALEKLLQLGKKKRAQSFRKMMDADIIQKLINFFATLNTAQDAKVFDDFDFIVGTVLRLCSSVIGDCRSVAIRDDFHALIVQLKRSIKTAVDVKKLQRNVLFEFVELEKSYREMAQKLKPTKQKKPAVMKPSPQFDFRTVPLLPTNTEVNQDTLNVVSRVRIRGPYDCVEQYLSDQFSLVREDYVDTIRGGLKLYREALVSTPNSLNYRYDSIRVYSAVHFEKHKFSDLGSIAYVVNFDPLEKITTDYETSKNFMHGSLLLFSRNNFQTFFCASIYQHDVEVLKTGKLYVCVEQNGDFREDYLYNVTFTMIEADVFWEPYSLVLKVLKGYSEESFPMCKYIVETSSEVDAPPYLYSFRDWDVFGHSTQPLDFDSWPEGEEIGLDAHQYDALKTALTKQFCVIQGPPGTGKTFLGLKIVEILLANMDAHEAFIRNPILVVCYTNHALDQFLEGILEFDTRIIRVGGQSRNEKLKRYNFKEKKALRKNPPKDTSKKRKDEAERRTYDADRKLRNMIGKGRRECSNLLFRIDQLDENLEVLLKPQGILSYDCLAEVIEEKNKEVFNSDYALIMWLLDEKEDNFPQDHEANNISCLDELKYDIVVDQNSLKKEIYAELFKTEDEKADDDEEEDPKEEVMTYGVSLNGLGAVCLHYRKELTSITDEKSIEYTWAKNHLIGLIHRYFILKENLGKTLVDDMLYRKTSQKDLLTLPLDHRWNTYFFWLRAKEEAIKAKIMALKKQYRSALNEVEELQQKEDASILATAAVVGMTTTSGALRHKVLELLKPSVVIVEEAAEVLEAHIVASLNQYTEHVILIGDHKQLKPSTAVYELARNYDLDCSLFERMLNNGMYCPTLRVQHRMRPEISSLITPSIYEKLDNHRSVEMYESIKGMLKNVFFIDHTNPDSDVENSTSYINVHEAAFCIQLCTYLVDQGYDSKSITLLTTYAAQVLHIKEAKTAKISHARVCTVDEYQGEENEIIILSLVRSNAQGNVGFLKIENRVCVALSRAKKGFYLIGNMGNLSRSSTLWQNVLETLARNDEIGPELTLRCEKHGTRTKVATAEDFSAVKGGGCKLKCGDILPCSHICAESCHIADPNHEEEFACRLSTQRTLECGHTADVPCCVKEYLCKERVEFRSRTCKHTLTRACFNLDLSIIVCENLCKQKLRCGHECPRICHQDDADHANYACQEVCGKKTRKCSRNHTCTKTCGEECGECTELEPFRLKCGHTPMLPCSTNLSKAKCPEMCGKICPDCRKPCEKQCWEDCRPCMAEVKRMIDECTHWVNIPCSSTLVPEMCNTLRKVFKDALCGHDLVYGVPCGISETDFDTAEYLANCEERCGAKLGCGHECKGTCGQCLQGRLHVGCKRTCDLTLPCGHQCVYACSDVCPPCCDYSYIGCKHTRFRRKCGSLYTTRSCQRRCESKCKHQACTNLCGDFCNREPCYRPCELKVKTCNHPCVGFCGETCICRWCDTRDELPAGKRFVKLSDCGCIVESHALEEHLTQSDPYVYTYVCPNPECEEPIVSTMRFMNRIKTKYNQIVAVSKKVHGLDQQLTNLRSQVIEELKQFHEFKDEGLLGIQKMKTYFSHAISDNYNYINKQDLASMSYFVQLFNTISRRLAGASKEMMARVEFRAGMKLVSEVLDRIDMRTLLKNTLMMSSLRMELIRMHRILDFCVLLQETNAKKLKKNVRLSEICEQIRSLIYAPKLFGIGKDRNVGELFSEFFSERPATDANYSFLDSTYMEIRYQDFLGGTMTVHGWMVCRKDNKHIYPDIQENGECPQC